jgi:hypothetical protein
MITDMAKIVQLVHELPDFVDKEVEEVLRRNIELFKGLAQVYVRVDTGSLRDSIRIERGGVGKRWHVYSLRAGGYVTNPRTRRRVDYAAVVEAKYPFMSPAWEQVKPALEEELKAIQERINEYVSE